MNTFRSIILFFTAILLISCQNEMEAVVAVHDELMPKMVDISRLQEQISEAIPDSLRTEEQQNTIDQLEAANTAMMDWMRDFGAAFDFEEINKGKPLNAAKADSLKKYAQSVEALKEQMLSAIEEGQSVFDALKQE
ncbi:hypothetical protein [Gilvibacter sediminis]|uniref:hypothetical protein n=1 Tax=Gilvibacter sediminis TaxID=379071 RepID=UPI00234FE382|nr:hypothetical protein [Gilvibacter sediminis]MDC7997421.1 hypothetical protein [Gilvibacter sediminis]